MGAVFNCVLSAIANLKHIGIIPMARPGTLFQSHLLVQYLQYPQALPVDISIKTIPDISRCTPQMPDAFSPFPGFVITPFADAEYDWLSTSLQGIMHGFVSSFCMLPFLIAPVVFQ